MKKTRAARAAMVRMNVVLRESLLRACVDSTTPTESPVRSTASGAAAHQWGQSAAVTASAFSGLLVNVFTDPFIGYFRNRFIFGQPGKHNDHITKLLIVGETVSVPGGWIGFPAHRHDYERPGKECVLDEIFSFQMTSTEDGPGRGGVMQHGYDLTDENKKIWDEVNVIEENNTAVALPTGYHTTVALPGTRAYLLWGLAGDTKKYKVQFDERYSWLEGCLY